MVIILPITTLKCLMTARLKNKCYFFWKFRILFITSSKHTEYLGEILSKFNYHQLNSFFTYFVHHLLDELAQSN